MSLSVTVLQNAIAAIITASPAATVTVRIAGHEASALRATTDQTPVQTPYGVDPGDTSQIFVQLSFIEPEGIKDGDRFEIKSGEEWVTFRAETVAVHGGAVTQINYRDTAST